MAAFSNQPTHWKPIVLPPSPRAQDDIGGLELWKPSEAGSDGGEWVPIPVVPDTILVNLGDYLSLLTLGAWRSPRHRGNSFLFASK